MLLDSLSLQKRFRDVWRRLRVAHKIAFTTMVYSLTGIVFHLNLGAIHNLA